MIYYQRAHLFWLNWMDMTSKLAYIEMNGKVVKYIILNLLKTFDGKIYN